jgi:hypothetical protein
MANPAFVSAANVLFNGTTENTAMIYHDTVNSKYYHVMWDLLTADQQNALTAAVTAAGGTIPLAAATSGYNTIKFTGVTSTAVPTFKRVATAGKVVIGVDPTATTATALTLPTGQVTSGSQRIIFQPTVTSALATGFPALAAGYQTVTFTAAIVGTNATGLANDTTTYTTTITINGTAIPITVTGSAAQTFTTLISSINTQLGAAGAVTISGSNLVVTSATTGSASTVLVVTGTLFPALTGFSQINAAVQGTGNTTPVQLTVTVDGTAHTVNAELSTFQTYGSLATAISTAIGAAGTAAFVANELVVTSASTGLSSTVAIVATNNSLSLFPLFLSLENSVTGTSKERSYSATIVIDGTHVIPVLIAGTSIATYNDVVTALTTAVGALGTVAMSGNITITSASTGSGSSVKVYDSGLFSMIFAKTTPASTEFVSTTGVADLVAKFYVAIDGAAPVLVSLDSASISTYADVVTAINTAISTAGTAAMSADTITITSASTGTTSSVAITDVSLVSQAQQAAQPVVLGTPFRGATTFIDVLKSIRVGAATLYDQLVIKVIGTKPNVPIGAQQVIQDTYFDGTVWRYLINDVQVP